MYHLKKKSICERFIQIRIAKKLKISQIKRKSVLELNSILNLICIKFKNQFLNYYSSMIIIFNFQKVLRRSKIFIKV